MKLRHGSEAVLLSFRRGADTETQRERARDGVGHPSLGQTLSCFRTQRRRHGSVVGCGADTVDELNFFNITKIEYRDNLYYLLFVLRTIPRKITLFLMTKETPLVIGFSSYLLPF